MAVAYIEIPVDIPSIELVQFGVTRHMAWSELVRLLVVEHQPSVEVGHVGIPELGLGLVEDVLHLDTTRTKPRHLPAASPNQETNPMQESQGEIRRVGGKDDLGLEVAVSWMAAALPNERRM